MPVIPGITDTRKNIDGILELLLKLKDQIHGIDLLPWHSLANAKYARFGKPNKMGNMHDLKMDDLLPVKKEFEDCGVKVRIGG
jgi:pyruvate formate lyase activating enzyme